VVFGSATEQWLRNRADPPVGLARRFSENLKATFGARRNPRQRRATHGSRPARLEKAIDVFDPLID